MHKCNPLLSGIREKNQCATSHGKSAVVAVIVLFFLHDPFSSLPVRSTLAALRTTTRTRHVEIVVLERLLVLGAAKEFGNRILQKCELRARNRTGLANLR